MRFSFRNRNNWDYRRAISKNRADKVIELIQLGNDLESVDKDGLRPLHMAVLSDQSVIVKLILAAGADVEAGGPRGFTALHLAASTSAVLSVNAMTSAISRS